MNGEELFSALLIEARQSPNLLEDLAALEGYLSETYSSRAFIELLQNADDAGATIVEFTFDGTKLISANNGKVFTDEDVQGLCRSGKSSKSRGSAIGYRGIGFKSTAALSNQILVSSGNYCFKFSKELTAKALGSSKRMPLIRVPHFGESVDAEWQDLRLGGSVNSELSTTFVFDVMNLSALEAEFENFRADYLLFLNNVVEVRMRYKQEEKVFHRSIDDASLPDAVVKLRSSEMGETSWLVSHQANFSLACAMANGESTPLRQDASLFHSFLPTNETTGLGVRINADFSTDPSRTKISLDEHTLEILDSVSTYLAKSLLSVALGAGDAIGNVLTPEDLQAGFLQSNKSVKFVLLEMTRAKVKALELLASFRTKPGWAENINLRLVADATEATPKLLSVANDEQRRFFKAAGLKPLSPSEILHHYETSTFTLQDRAALISQLVGISALASEVDLEQLTSSPIWETQDGERLTLPQSLAKNAILSESFLEALAKIGVSTNSLRNLIQRVNPRFAELIGTPIEDAKQQSKVSTGWTVLGGPSSSNISQFDNYSGAEEPRWRAAEILVLNRLRQAGFDANDVSRQFVGYDINARIEGIEYFVEVKKVSSFSEPFTLTSNEQAFASQMGEKFVLAVVSMSADGLASTLAFIPNPAAKLQFERQCQKWVWECSAYRDHLQESID
jgi:hypothetical protein